MALQGGIVFQTLLLNHFLTLGFLSADLKNLHFFPDLVLYTKYI